jgi:hypothetical protein
LDCWTTLALLWKHEVPFSYMKEIFKFFPIWYRDFLSGITGPSGQTTVVIRYKAMDAYFKHLAQYSYMNEILPSGIAKNISSGM